MIDIRHRFSIYLFIIPFRPYSECQAGFFFFFFFFGGGGGGASSVDLLNCLLVLFYNKVFLSQLRECHSFSHERLPGIIILQHQ